MIETFMRRLLERIKKASAIAVVGAGKNGQILCDRLREEKIKIDYIMDNNKSSYPSPPPTTHRGRFYPSKIYKNLVVYT